MRVYRGPSTKSFHDELTELVASVDLTKDTSPWSKQKRVTVNISKSQASERSADAYIEFEPGDILALCSGLIAGFLEIDLKERSERRKDKALLGALAEIVRCAAPAIEKNDLGALEKIRSIAWDAMKVYHASAP